MKITVQIEDKALDTYNILTKKSQIITNFSNDWSIKRSYDNSCIIIGKDSDLDNTYKVLSDIIIEFLELRYLVKILKTEYAFLSENEQCEILIYTIKNMWGNKDTLNEIEYAKEDVKNRLLDTNTPKQTLNLEGFMRFRMKDYLISWKNTLKKSIDSYLLNQEYNEFISVVKYFIIIKKSKFNAINVYINDKYDFSVYDDKMNFIDDSKKLKENLANASLTKIKDLLLSVLISIAPKQVTIHNSNYINDEVFFDMLNKIFDDNVILKN